MMNRTSGKSRKKRLKRKRSAFPKFGQEDIVGIIQKTCSKYNLNSDQTRNAIERVLAQVPGSYAVKDSLPKKRNSRRHRRLQDESVRGKRVYYLAEQVARDFSKIQSSPKAVEVRSVKIDELDLSEVSYCRPQKLTVSKLVINTEIPSDKPVQMPASAEIDRLPPALQDKVMVIPINLSAAELTKGNLFDVNITALDISIEELAKSKVLNIIKSLNLSRLNLSDDMVKIFFSNAILKNLRWLDLSGNRDVTEEGVRSICSSVKNGSLPQLDWLNLIGTSFDATPYVDGHYWRISNNARKLAADYGFQRWMMLGSRNPDLENDEVLTNSERRFPPGTFRSS